ncbi:YhcH/YjgK/YiaL family protein [Serratia sp. (in: enterobacteria)]|uniref:YhcH/YjgK/YiaL family protein n=1 Tax=Serratia sp. (in: enterobacteria) TaxID=616 RepID=UPI00398A37E6
MIICDLKDWDQEKHAFHPIFHQAITFIQQTDFSELPLGKLDIIPGKMFCLLQEMNTVPAEQMRAESHFDFVDIQYLLRGEETIGVARRLGNEDVVEQRLQHDIVFYQQTHNEIPVTLLPGMFAVFFPHDLHRPCCQSRGEVLIRKAVIKIHLSLFTEVA